MKKLNLNIDIPDIFDEKQISRATSGAKSGLVNKGLKKSPETIQRMRQPKSPEHRAKLKAIILEARLKASSNGHSHRPCTVDGVTIYPSVRALIKALGQGKAGAKHPNFRYV